MAASATTGQSRMNTDTFPPSVMASPLTPPMASPLVSPTAVNVSTYPPTTSAPTPSPARVAPSPTTEATAPAMSLNNVTEGRNGDGDEQRLNSSEVAPTSATTRDGLEAAVAATTALTMTNWLRQWRIEINRRPHKTSGGFTYHWNYRVTLTNSQRVTVYGGTLAVLMGLNKERWNDYQERSKQYARRRRPK